MINGNWVPISKALTSKLPTMREYSEVEAMFSIAVDYDCQNSASVAGYASLWGWSRKRVNTFLNKYGLVIEYQTKFDRHKKGKVSLTQLDVPAREQVGNRRGTGKGQVEFIDSRALRSAGNRKGTGREQVGNRKGSTTKDPNPNPNPNNKSVKGKRFVPPSIEEVKKYCLERSNTVDPQRWLDHYTSNGWMVGKNKMKDWKAAVRTWERNGKDTKPKESHNGFDSRDYSKDATDTSSIPDYLR